MAKGGAKKAAAAAARAAANRMLADNRQARHQYEILETLETGIELVGTEVKSPHSHAGAYFNHDPLRTRKLLAHRREIDKLRGQLDQKGLALIPLNIHLKGSWIKLTIGLGKGRKLHDKRAAEKEKQSKKEVKAAIARF